MKKKQDILGQFFTKSKIVEKLLNLLFVYKNYDKQIRILEPSFGTGNFIKGLAEKEFLNVDGCEIDEEFAETPSDFFELPLTKKYDLIIGNPPFSKYNIKESYYFKNKYFTSCCSPSSYLTRTELRKNKEKVENVFVLKSLKHLKSRNSTLALILPISFFIKNKNKSVKDQVLKYFSTIIIYQNDKAWFDRHIPCCFAIFTNVKKYKNKIILIFENKNKYEETFTIKNIYEELIPQIVFYKNNGYIRNEKGIPLKNFLDTGVVRVKKSYKENNVSAKNILDRTVIPENEDPSDYRLAVVRVGNASVGKTGLVNIKKDILNDMFYVFDVRDRFRKNKQLKETICNQINNNLDYFRKITCRVGSKSIKKEDILKFKIQLQ